jgi:hypothetical protein
MKKIATVVALALLAGAAFAQDLPPPNQGGGPGMMRGPGIEWKLGTVVTIEYKRVTGTVTLGDKGPAILRVNGTDYQLHMPRRSLSLLNNGGTVTVEGAVTTVQSDTKVQPFIDAFKVTVNGTETDVRPMKGWHGHDGDQQDPPQGN